jgi:hypothetical protein
VILTTKFQLEITFERFKNTLRLLRQLGSARDGDARRVVACRAHRTRSGDRAMQSFAFQGALCVSWREFFEFAGNKRSAVSRERLQTHGRRFAFELVRIRA